MKQLLAFSLSLVLSLFVIQVKAALPKDYNAVVVKSASSFGDRVFDLDPALKKAKAENKHILLYLGANDCPTCKEYELFLSRNLNDLKSAFDKHVVVDIQTWVRGGKMYFVANSQKHSVAEFQKLVGDMNKEAYFPNIWLISTDLKQVRQLPWGAKEFLNVAKHKELLQ
jgi:thioredoxin-related protein